MQHADNLIYTLVLFFYMMHCEMKVTSCHFQIIDYPLLQMHLSINTHMYKYLFLPTGANKKPAVCQFHHIFWVFISVWVQHRCTQSAS